MKSITDKPRPLNPQQTVLQSAEPFALQDEPSNMRYDELVLSTTELVDLMRQVLSRGNSFHFHARGGSMAPFIRDGDGIYISPFRQGEPGLGDVAAFLQPQNRRLIVHRVIGKHGSTCLIQGDEGYGHLDEVPQEYLLGKVTQVERNGRRIRLGLGPERYLISLSSRRGLLIPVMRSFRSLFGRLNRLSKR